MSRDNNTSQGNEGEEGGSWYNSGETLRKKEYICSWAFKSVLELGQDRLTWAPLVTWMVENLPAMKETWVRTLGQEDPLEEGMATHSSTLTGRIPVDREAWRATVHGVSESQTEWQVVEQLTHRLMWRMVQLGGQQREQRPGDKSECGSVDWETMSNWLKHRIDALMKMPGTSVRRWKLPFMKFPLIFTESESCSVVSNSLWPHGLHSSWNSPGQNIGVGSCCLLQGIFPTQGSNPGLLHCRQILYQLNCQGSPRILEGSLFLLQWIFPTQKSNQSLLHCRWILTNWATREALFLLRCWERLKGTTEDEMVGWHHRRNGHEFEQALGDGEGQRNLVCCSPWGGKESATMEWLNNSNNIPCSLQRFCTEEDTKDNRISGPSYFCLLFSWNSELVKHKTQNTKVNGTWN